MNFIFEYKQIKSSNTLVNLINENLNIRSRHLLHRILCGLVFMLLGFVYYGPVYIISRATYSCMFGLLEYKDKSLYSNLLLAIIGLLLSIIQIVNCSQISIVIALIILFLVWFMVIFFVIPDMNLTNEFEDFCFCNKQDSSFTISKKKWLDLVSLDYKILIHKEFTTWKSFYVYKNKGSNQLFVKNEDFLNITNLNNNFKLHVLNCIINNVDDLKCSVTHVEENNNSITVISENLGIGQGSCIEELDFKISDMFNKFYHKQISKGHPYNHISRDAFEGSTEIYGFQIGLFLQNNYYDKNKKKKVNLSLNKNPELPPCTLNERLSYIDEYVPCINNTRKQLNRYLKYIAHLYHNTRCRNYLITEERKVRWYHHVRWVVSSPAIGLIVEKEEILPKIDVKPDIYQPEEKLYEIKTITNVNYKEGYTEEDISYKKEEKISPIFDFKYKIIEHAKGNNFVVEDLESKRRMTKKIPAYIRDETTKKPYYPDEECVDKTLAPLKNYLEENKAFYCKESRRYHILFKKSIEEEKIVKKKVIEPIVTFNELEYEIEIKSDAVTKPISKKNHDLQWKEVTRKSYVTKLKDIKDSVVSYNKFSVLAQNKKISKKLNFKFNSNIQVSFEDRDIIRGNLNPPKTKKEKRKIVEKVNHEAKEIKMSELIEAKINTGIVDEVKKRYPSRLRFFPRNNPISFNNIIKGLEKGFFTKHEYNVKKSFREVAFNYLLNAISDESLFTELKKRYYRGKVSHVYDYDSYSDDMEVYE